MAQKDVQSLCLDYKQSEPRVGGWGVGRGGASKIRRQFNGDPSIMLPELVGLACLGKKS